MKETKKRAIILFVICLVICVGGLIANYVMSNPYLVEIKYDDLMEKIDNKEDFVLLISQTTCTHCISYKPKLESVAREYKIKIYYIDVDLLSEKKVKEIKSHFNYEGTPTTVFVIDGDEKTSANRINGDTSKEKIINKLKKNGFID